MSVLGAPPRKMTSTFAPCRKALPYLNLEIEDLRMKKCSSYLEINDSYPGRVDGSPPNLESVASVTFTSFYARNFKSVYNLQIHVTLSPKLSSVDLEKAIRLQQGQMTYKFERLGVCRAACMRRLKSSLNNYSDEQW